MDVELTSDHYRRSPLVHGGLEINATPRQVTERYSTLIEDLYVQLREEEILCSFILVNDSENMYEDFSVHQRSTRPRKQPSKPNESTTKSKNIRRFSNNCNKERNDVADVCSEKK